jgi:hypothetical protein
MRVADARGEFEIPQRSPKGGSSILMFQNILAVSLTRKAVVADRHNYTDRHNPITYVIFCYIIN